MDLTIDVHSRWLRVAVQVGSAAKVGAMATTPEWYSRFVKTRRARMTDELAQRQANARNAVKLRAAWTEWVGEQFNRAEELVNQFNDDMDAEQRTSETPVSWQHLKFKRLGSEFIVEDETQRFFIRAEFDNESLCVVVRTNVSGGDLKTQLYEVSMSDAGVIVPDVLEPILMPAFTAPA